MIQTGSNTSSKGSYEYVLKLDDIIEFIKKEHNLKLPNAFRQRFELGGLIKDEDDLENKLSKEIEWQKNKSFPDKENSPGSNEQKKSLDFLNRLNTQFELLSPKNILSAGYTDCKGKAILAVSFYREQNRPVKLVASYAHVFIELWRNREQKWMLFDPSYISWTTKTEPNRDREFEFYYEEIINHFNGFNNGHL